MAASRTSGALGTGCEGRDNIGKGKTRLTRGKRSPHLKDTRKLHAGLVFHGRCRCVTIGPGRAAVMRHMLALPRMFPHLDLKKCTVERENEGVKLIEPRDVQ